MIIIKKFILLLISIVIFMEYLLIMTYAESKFTVNYKKVENLGDPIVSIKIIASAATIEDGNPIACQPVSGDPAILNIIDLKSKSLIRSFEIPYGKDIWTMETDSKGNVYFAGYSSPVLYKYSPSDKKLYDLGSCLGEGAVCQIAIDDNDNIYMATYPNAKLLKYDAVSNKIKDLGKMFSNADYFKSLVYHNGYLYGGSLASSPTFLKINVNTLEKEEIANPNISATIKSFYSGTRAGDKIFYWCETSNGNSSGFIGGYVVFDTVSGKFLDLYLKDGRGLYTTPDINGYAYLPCGNYIYKYDLSTNEVTQTTRAYSTGFRCKSFIKADNWSAFPNGAFVNSFYGGGTGLYDFSAGKSASVNPSLKANATPLVGIRSVGDFVWVSGHMGPVAVKYDPNSKAVVTSINMEQSTAITEIDGKIYFGSYPSASINVFDPSKPIVAKENPKELFNVKSYGQSRMMRIIQAGDKIAVASVADYNMLQGAWSIYDPITKEVECFTNLTDMGVTALAYKDGILYGSTTIYGGLGSTPTRGAAKIFRYDLASKKLLSSSTPVLKSVEGSPKVIGDLKFGPDGLLWTVTDGVVYAVDPDTLEVKKEVSVFGMSDSYYKGRVDPYSLAFDSKGILYCNPRQTLVAIDTNTLEYDKLLNSDFDFLTKDVNVDQFNNIYFFKNATLFRLPRINTPYIKQFSTAFVGINEDESSYGVVFGTANQLINSNKLIEFGMLLAKTELSAEEFQVDNEKVFKAKGIVQPNAVGQFGIQFVLGSLLGTYYTRAYAVYQTGLETQTVYSDDVVDFIIPIVKEKF